MKQYAISFVSLSFLLFSCNDSDVINSSITTQLSDGLIHQVEFMVEDPICDFESTRGLTYTGSAVPFVWALNDTVGIYPDAGDQISFSMAEGAGTTSAMLDGGAWALKADSKYSAYYPFNRKNFFNDRNSIILDYTGQKEKGIANADHLAKYDYQAANFTNAVNGKLSFDMKRLNCILILRLTIPQAGTYTDLTITSESKVFTTKSKLSLGEQYLVTPIEKSYSMHLALEGVTTTANNQVADFLIMLAPVDLSGKTFEVTLKGANGYLYKGTKTPTSAYSANKTTRTSITLKLDTSSNIGFGGEFTTEETTL